MQRSTSRAWGCSGSSLKSVPPPGTDFKHPPACGRLCLGITSLISRWAVAHRDFKRGPENPNWGGGGGKRGGSASHSAGSSCSPPQDPPLRLVALPASIRCQKRYHRDVPRGLQKKRNIDPGSPLTREKSNLVKSKKVRSGQSGNMGRRKFLRTPVELRLR